MLSAVEMVLNIPERQWSGQREGTGENRWWDIPKMRVALEGTGKCRALEGT